MTTSDLVDSLANFIKNATKDLMLPVRVVSDGAESKTRTPIIYKMRVPTKEAEIQQIPYIVVQHLKGKDERDENGIASCTAVIRILIATYSENQEEGAISVENIINRIRIPLLKQGIIAKKYLVNMPLEYVIYPDPIPPYYLGEMITNWQVPPVEREVRYD
ncbi:MAG: hypothetical protein R3Y63_14020 [Eubacteriales bacterium]